MQTATHRFFNGDVEFTCCRESNEECCPCIVYTLPMTSYRRKPVSSFNCVLEEPRLDTGFRRHDDRVGYAKEVPEQASQKLVAKFTP
jgi:hypothetical protein